MLSRDEQAQLRIIFAGTPQFAADILTSLLHDNYNIVACYTQSDKPAGRGKHLTSPPVKQVAQAHNIPVEQPINFKEPATIERLATYQADLMLVAAYGLLLPPQVLAAPKLGCVNVHTSLLPRWRGAAPIARAILAGDTETGVCLMRMDAGLDTGAILATASCTIANNDTTGSLTTKLMTTSQQLLALNLRRIAKLSATTQASAGVTYAKKITKLEAALDWRCSAVIIDRQVRAFNPWPIAYTTAADTMYKIWQGRIVTAAAARHLAAGQIIEVTPSGIIVVCGYNSGYLIEQLQIPGKKPMSIKELLNGRLLEQLVIGSKFSSADHHQESES